MQVPSWQPVSRKRVHRLSLFVLGSALAGMAVVGAAMLRPHGLPGPHDLPAIGVAPVVFAEPWWHPLPIHVTPPEIARKGFIHIDGLPALALLSEGHATRPGSWTVPASRLATLKITSPGTEEAQPRLSVALVSADGILLSEARPLLAVMHVERFAPQPSAVLPAQCPARLRPPKAAEEPAAAWVWPGARQEAESLVRRGDDALARGSIGAARQIYEYVADEMRWPTAALALAATYDPHELAWLAPFVVADAEKARAWYEQARALADARIDFHLRRLGPPARAPAEPLRPMGDEPAPEWVWFGAMEAKTIVRWGDEALARSSIEAARQNLRVRRRGDALADGRPLVGRDLRQGGACASRAACDIGAGEGAGLVRAVSRADARPHRFPPAAPRRARGVASRRDCDLRVIGWTTRPVERSKSARSRLRRPTAVSLCRLRWGNAQSRAPDG